MNIIRRNERTGRIRRLKFETLTRLIIILALILPTAGQMVNESSASRVGYGKASLVGTVDIRALPPLLLASSIGARQSAAASPRSSSNPTFSIGFDGISSSQEGALRTFPPDVYVATGPNYVMEIVNVLGAIYTRQGSLYQTVNLHSLFNWGGDLTDPKILFDYSSRRWFASIATTTAGFNVGNITIAVSTTLDPFTWNLYSLCPGLGGTCPGPYQYPLFPDQPILGISDDKVAVSADDYASAGATFVGSQYWVLNKSEMVSGARTVDYFTHGPDKRFASLHPVQSLSSTSTQYMVTVGENSTERQYCNACNNRLVISLIGVPPGLITNQTSLLNMQPIIPPPDTVQKNGTIFRNPPPYAFIDNSDTRVQTAVWFRGMLWFALNDGCNPPGDSLRACLRFVQFDTSKISVKQDFDYGALGKYYFYPALSMDGNGNLDVVYGFSSPNDYPSLAITGRLSSDPPGRLATPVTIRSGLIQSLNACAQANPSSSNYYCRYGDYFGAGVDPSSPSNVWVAGQYSNGASTWATFIAEMHMQLSPGFTLSTNPSSVNLTCNRFGCNPGSADSTLTVTSVDGFAGTIAVTYSGSWGSVTGPATVSVSAGGSSSVTITASHGGGGANVYLWTISGQSGQITAITSLTIVYYYCANCV